MFLNMSVNCTCLRPWTFLSISDTSYFYAFTVIHVYNTICIFFLRMDYTSVYESMFFQLVICTIYSSVNMVEPYSTLVQTISKEVTVVKEYQNMSVHSFSDKYRLSLDDPCKMYLYLSKALALFSEVFFLLILLSHHMIWSSFQSCLDIEFITLDLLPSSLA